MNRRAFTLIELLIVVAIIAILAAIAVPNFLEAQTRSKVSRVKSDMRAVATALEAYSVDNNRYPTMQDPTPASSGFTASDCDLLGGVVGNWNSDPTLLRLTTPVAYIASLTATRDPFLAQRNILSWGKPWTLLTSNMYFNYDEFMASQPTGQFRGWGLVSVGPNGMPEGGNHVPRLAAMYARGGWGADYLANAYTRVYDPTNGTVSVGDICRFGGAVPGGTPQTN